MKGNSGIWWTDGASSLRLVARTGEVAPGAATFASFSTVVLPNGATSGPVFQGTPTLEPAANVTATSKVGVWAVSPAGNLWLILRTGGRVYYDSSVNGLVKSFSALTGAVGSMGTARGVDDAGYIRVNVIIKNEPKPGDKHLQFGVFVPLL